MSDKPGRVEAVTVESGAFDTSSMETERRNALRVVVKVADKHASCPEAAHKR